MEPYIGAIGIIGEAHRKICSAVPIAYPVQGAQSLFEILSTPTKRDLPLPATDYREAPDPLTADAHLSDEH